MPHPIGRPVGAGAQGDWYNKWQINWRRLQYKLLYNMSKFQSINAAAVNAAKVRPESRKWARHEPAVAATDESNYGADWPLASE